MMRLEVGKRTVVFPERVVPAYVRPADLWEVQAREIELADALEALFRHWERWHYAGHSRLHQELHSRCKQVLSGPSGSILRQVRREGILMALRSLKELGYSDAEDLVRAEMEADDLL